jgi:hypothetical protein
MTTESVILSVSRINAGVRGGLWLSAAIILVLLARLIYGRLTFVSTGASNALVDYSVAIIALPIPILGLVLLIVGLRWILLAVWPAKLGIEASENELILRLGPFGTKRFDADRIEVRYPFELRDDEADVGFEAYLPEETQYATFVPRMIHPEAREAIHRTILRFASVDEKAAAAALGPILRQWRERNPSVSRPEK